MYIWITAHAITAAIISLLLLPPLKNMLKKSGAVKQNFRQREVINMTGLLVILVWLVLMALASLAPMIFRVLGFSILNSFVISPDVAMVFTLIIIGTGFFGLIDDLLGDRKHSGFRGHIGALFRGELTTGALKAIGIPVVAIIISAQFSPNIAEVLGNAILVALFVNALNLLDLRPGRALKVYIPLQLLFVFAMTEALGAAAAALAAIALVLIGPDLQEEIMLGDTGANILGGVLGLCFAVSYGWNIKIPIIILLLVLQVLTEKYSLSAIIERTPVLRAFDNLGRRAD
jgi:UDP-N-acetylmuramyl pentapeptide phosphotransferase/UDP-N-acetylglucosamine-1-phosphate transferase